MNKMNLSIHKLKSNLIAYFLILSHIFHMHFCSNNANVLRIIGAVNRTVSIPCPVYNVNDSIDLILWFRDNQESALYSLDARTTPIERAKQTPIDESFSRRAFIDVSKKPSALTIFSIQKSDAGLYKCRVDFRKNRTQYRSIRLNVIDGPKEVTILDADSVILRDGSEAGPYNENGHLVLVCETEATEPPVNLYWYRNDELIDTSFEETEQRVVRNELTVMRLTREHLQNRFTCKATNSNLTISKESTVVLELNLRPLKVKIIGPKHPINAGERVTLVCESEGSRPNATISFWTRNENYEDNYIDKSDYFGRKSIKDSWISSTLISSDFSSKLTLLVNESYNNKQIICRAEHPILPDSAIEDVYTLNVRYPPKVSLTLGSSSSREQIYEKSNVTFVCHVNANPTPTSILWFFNDEPISKSHLIYHENSTELLIQNVNTDSRGNFSCMAISESGNGVSDPVNLKVLYSPICSTERTTYGVSTSEPVEIKCRVDSVPPAHTFFWSLNSSSHHKPMPLHGFHNQIKGQMSISTLNYSAKTHLGYGTLQCWSANSVGKQQVPCTFDVVPGRIPDKLSDCIVGNQSLSTLLIKCDAGSDGGLEQRFHLEVYKSGTGKLIKKLNSTARPLFEVDGLPRSTTFVLILYSSNAKGKSDTTTFVASTLPFPNKELIIITPLIAILMGVMACFACTAISIVIISKIKNPQKQTKSSKYPRRKGSFGASDAPEDDSTSNLSDLVFNNQAINLKFSSNGSNFHSTTTSSPNELYNYTTLELAKDHLAKSSGYRSEHLSSLASSKRYIMITNQKSGIHQLNETASLPMDQTGVPINSDQSPINFLLFQN